MSIFTIITTIITICIMVATLYFTMPLESRKNWQKTSIFYTQIWKQNSTAIFAIFIIFSAIFLGVNQLASEAVNKENISMVDDPGLGKKCIFNEDGGTISIDTFGNISANTPDGEYVNFNIGYLKTEIGTLHDFVKNIQIGGEYLQAYKLLSDDLRANKTVGDFTKEYSGIVRIDIKRLLPIMAFGKHEQGDNFLGTFDIYYNKSDKKTVNYVFGVYFDKIYKIEILK